MVKRGYKHCTTAFGSDAEALSSRYFLMMKNPNGHRRPDLISVNGVYEPKLSIECKSGAKLKGVLVDYQLHYSITSGKDYKELFGEEVPRREKMLEGFDWEENFPLLAKDSVAYYYDMVDRIDGLRSDDIRKPFSTIKIKWGDHHLVPAEYAFYAFVASRHMRTREPVQEIIHDLHDLMRSDIEGHTSHYEERKKNKQSWQDIHARDMLALFYEDEKYATEEGKKRIELIRELYPAVDSLKRIEIPSYNGQRVYVLAEPEHSSLLNKTFKKVVNGRCSVIEDLIKERKEAEEILNYLPRTTQGRLIDMASDESESRILDRRIGRNQINLLRRLVSWRPANEADIIEGRELIDESEPEEGEISGREENLKVKFDSSSRLQEEVIPF